MLRPLTVDRLSALEKQLLHPHSRHLLQPHRLHPHTVLEVADYCTTASTTDVAQVAAKLALTPRATGHAIRVLTEMGFLDPAET